MSWRQIHHHTSSPLKRDRRQSVREMSPVLYCPATEKKKDINDYNSYPVNVYITFLSGWSAITQDSVKPHCGPFSHPHSARVQALSLQRQYFPLWTRSLLYLNDNTQFVCHVHVESLRSREFVASHFMSFHLLIHSLILPTHHCSSANSFMTHVWPCFFKYEAIFLSFIFFSFDPLDTLSII